MKDFSYGARAKIGLIYPSPGWVMEPEFYAMSPEGVITCTTRISLLETNAEQLSLIGSQGVEAARLLSQAPLDVIALGCTSGSFIGGCEYDRELIENMESASNGIPCITTSGAAVTALKALGVKKIAVATPYIGEVNERGKKYLEESGFEVTNLIGLNLLYDREIDSQSLETVYKLAKAADTEDAEAIAILCTGIRSIGILQHLEKDLGKPVISAIQATFWHALRISGVKDSIRGYGSLLEKY
ncbi:MAG: Asp/Glu racemase [Tissierella sp.]|nr:Asp/Glu racemase [Tissierella sp.]